MLRKAQKNRNKKTQLIKKGAEFIQGLDFSKQLPGEAKKNREKRGTNNKFSV